MWDHAASRAIGAHLLDRHRRRIAERVDSTGRAYPPGRDNVETGRLAQSFSAQAHEKGATISNSARHAAPVNKLVPIMGLSGAEIAALEADDGPLVAEIERLERGLP